MVTTGIKKKIYSSIKIHFTNELINIFYEYPFYEQTNKKFKNDTTMLAWFIMKKKIKYVFNFL